MSSQGQLVCQNTKSILHYTPGSGESVVKYSLMVLHVSDGKRVHQALVDPKSIVPYYVVFDISSDGSSNDASIYNGSELKEGLESPNNIFNLPEEKSLPGDDVPVPY
jgi:hypothetical protein